MKKQLKFLHSIPRNTYIAIGALLFAVVGTVLLVSSHAATPTASFEAEAGTRSGTVATVSDSSASGTSAVKFGTAASSSCATPDRVTVTTANKSTYPAYPVNTKVYVPDGPDPWGGCFPGPSNTGYPHGVAGDTRTPVTLTTYTGPCTITAANTTIDKKDVNCDPLTIQAKNVVITNSNITGRIYLDDTLCNNDPAAQTASFSVSDTTIYTTWIQSRALMYCNYTATRVNASGGGSMAECRDCTIKDSYFHDPLEDPTGEAHNSTVRVAQYANILHNTLQCIVKQYAATNGSGDESGCSANQTAYSHDGIPPYNSTVKQNFYGATTGGYCGYGGSTGGDGASQVHDVTFIQNVFQRGNMPSSWNPAPQYICGYWGPITSLDLTLPGNAWTSNTWDNGKSFTTDSATWGDVCSTQPNCTW